MIAALLTITAAGLEVGGFALARRLVPALTFLALAIPLQTDAYRQFIVYLQGLTARGSGGVLDVVGIYHFQAGNVLEVAGRPLLVEEACSGIQSLSAVFTSTLLFAFWIRRSALHTALLALSSVGCALLVNIGRVVAVAMLSARSGATVSEIGSHTGLGLLAFAVTLLSVLSADQLLLFLFLPAPWQRAIPLSVLKANSVWLPTLSAPVETQPRRLPASLCVFATTFAALGLVQWWWFWPGWTPSGVSGTVPGERLESLGADALPARLGKWQFVDYSVKQRERGDQYGDRSLMWHYQRGPVHAAVALDYPFPRWHELTDCYCGTGWIAEGRQVHRATEAAGEAEACFVDVTLTKPMERYGYLWFGLMDEQGGALQPRPENFWERVQTRLAAAREGAPRWHTGVGAADDVAGRCYQVQLFVESHTPLTEVELAEARSFFQQARRLVRGHFLRAHEEAR